MGEDWVQKYQPKSVNEIQGQNKPVGQLKNHVEKHEKGSKPVLLHGPPGTGKTSAVYAIAGDLNLEVVEVNASDVRNKQSIKDVVGGALEQQSLFSQGKIILVDEIDGLSGNQDRGGIQALTKLMKNSSYPIIFTANDPYDQKFSKLRRKCRMIQFGNLNYRSVAARLKDVMKAEGIEWEENALKKLARRADGDMRGAINDLQTIAGDGELTEEDLEVLGVRQRKDSIFDALKRVFKTTNADVARGAYDEIAEDLDEIFLWLEKNIPKEYKKPKDLARAYDALSIADVFYGRIQRWQHYRFYVYCYDLLSAGIALAKDEKYGGWTKYQRSQKPLKIWRANNKLKKKKDIAHKVATKTHTSISRAMQDTIPFFKLPFNKNESFATDITGFFDLSDDEVDWMKE